MKRRIPIAGPWITDREVEMAAEAARTAWYDDAQVYQERFQKAFAETHGRDHALCLPSCTSGLHLILAALGVGPGDEVIVPDVTWIASVAPVDYVGATPVFAEIDREHWCVTEDTIARCVTPRTKAVIVVDLYGNVPDLPGIEAYCANREIFLIEDSAEAFGTRIGGRRAGSFGVASAFSFHGSKTLTTGEGGMLVLNDSELALRCAFLRDHGRPPGDRSFYNTEIGFKYRMSAMQAAVGLAQLERMDELVERKREVFGWYRDRLAGVPGVALNPEPDGVHNSYWMSSAVLDPRYRLTSGEIMRAMDARGIDCRPFFHPLSSLPPYENTEAARVAQAENAVSREVSRHGVNLPSASSLTEEQVETVCHAFLSMLRDTDVAVA